MAQLVQCLAVDLSTGLDQGCEFNPHVGVGPS